MARVRGCWTMIGALVMIASFVAPTWAGSQMMVKMNESFEIDGQLFPAGVVTLKEVAEYSPVTTLNEVWVDGTCLGLLMAREVAGATSDRDELIFARSADGHLVLEGFATRGNTTRELQAVRQRSPEGQRYTRLDSGDVASRVR